MSKNFVSYENIDYNKLDKVLDSLDFIKKSKKAKMEYANVACAFDTETTSTEVNGQKVSFTYIWQFALTDEFYCYGRTWQDFKLLINYISSHLSLNTNHALICYIHNLSFEFQFMRKWFEWESVFSTKDRNPIQAMTKQGVEFRDSYILSGLTLEKTAENLTSHEVKKLVGDLDYSLVRTEATPVTEKELGYMLNDVVILIYYITEQIKLYENNIAKIPLTNTGRVRMAVREKAFSEKNGYLTRKQMSMLTLTPELYLQLKDSFAGGFTHANPNYVGKIVHDVQSMDFTSSYPTVLLSSRRFPMGRPQEYYIRNEKQKELFLKNVHNDRIMLFFTATFKNLVTKIDFENYLSESKCFDTEGLVENNGRVWMADKLSVTICSIDFEIIERCYDWEDVEFSDIIFYSCDYLPKYMLESAIQFYQKKTTLKGVAGKEQEYQLFKGMLNSLYGMMVTDLAKPEIIYGENWGKELANLKEVTDKYNKDKTRFLYYAWGVVVTALARQNLWSGILELKSDYVYSDTDSVKFINREKHRDYFIRYNNWITNQLKQMCKMRGFDYNDLAPKTVDGERKPLGVWDNDGFYSHFKTLGAKRYVCIEDYFDDDPFYRHYKTLEAKRKAYNKGGKLKTTIAGLGKDEGADYLLKISDGDPVKAMKNFNIGLRVPAGETGKNTHTYIDKEFKGEITDYLGVTHEVESLSSIHLEPTSFDMTMSETFADFLVNMISTGDYEINEVYYG